MPTRRSTATPRTWLASAGLALLALAALVASTERTPLGRPVRARP